MRTVSLRRRVVGAGVGVVVIVFAIVDVFVWVNVREYLDENLKRVLEHRAELAVAFAPTIDSAELARLAGSEVTVSVLDPTGRETEGSPEEETSATAGARLPEPGALTRRVRLPNGDTVVLTASRTDLERTLRRVVVSEVLGTLLGLGLAVFLLARASRLALRPIDAVVLTARQITSGDLGGRLRPDHTDTELGRLAVAFDEMLDALEKAVAEARASEEAERRFLAEAAHQLRPLLPGSEARLKRCSSPTTRPSGRRCCPSWQWRAPVPAAGSPGCSESPDSTGAAGPTGAPAMSSPCAERKPNEQPAWHLTSPSLFRRTSRP